MIFTNADVIIAQHGAQSYQQLGVALYLTKLTLYARTLLTNYPKNKEIAHLYFYSKTPNATKYFWADVPVSNVKHKEMLWQLIYILLLSTLK